MSELFELMDNYPQTAVIKVIGVGGGGGNGDEQDLRTSALHNAMFAVSLPTIHLPGLRADLRPRLMALPANARTPVTR